MSIKREDGTCVCDCGDEFDSSSSLGSHSKWCDKYTSLTVERACEQCGDTFEVLPYKIERGHGKYCNRGCMGKSQRGEHYDERRGDAWVRRAREARARDNWTCQDCGISQEACGETLHVHHKIPRRLFDDKEQANEMDNLITLCVSCHRKHEPTL